MDGKKLEVAGDGYRLLGCSDFVVEFEIEFKRIEVGCSI